MTSRATDESTMEAGKPAGAYAFALAAAELASNTRSENVVLLDLRGRSPVTEFFVIATGSSPRQMRTVVEEIRDLGKKMGFGAWQTSGLESGRWILVDCVSVVCHVFDVDSRDFYDLELLWGDCPRIDWRKELGLPPASERDDSSRGGFREGSHLDQLDAQEGDEEDLTEEEDGDGEDTELPVVVELPDESTGSNSVEFVEIDPPGKRGKRRSALYPTPIGELDSADAESAVHVVTMREAAEASMDEDDVAPTPRKAKAKKKPAAKKVLPKKASAKKVAVKKVAVKEKASAKKKVAAKKSPARKVPAKKKAAKPAAKKKKR